MFKKALLASAAVMAAGVASAEVTGNFAIVSDYVFRGVESGDTAVQGGLDYAHDSGLYAGVWLSTAAIGNSDGSDGANDEIDYYVGYGLGLSEGLSLDLGYIRYTSDSTAAGDIDEVYVGLAGEAWGATVYYGDNARAASSDEDNYLYLDLGYSMSTGETTSVDLHVGLLDPEASGADEVIDYGITYNVGDFNMGLSTTDVDDDDINVVIGWGTSFDVK